LRSGIASLFLVSLSISIDRLLHLYDCSDPLIDSYVDISEETQNMWFMELFPALVVEQDLTNGDELKWKFDEFFA